MIHAEERLVKPEDELLEVLTQVIIRVFHVVSVFHVLLPEPPSPDQDVRHADGPTLTVGQEAHKLDDVIEVGRQVPRRLIVVVAQEEQAFRSKPGEVVCPAVREVTRSRAVVQIERSGKLCFQPLLRRSQPPHLLDLHEDLVQTKEFVFRFALLRHKGTNVLMIRVGIRIDACIRDGIFVHKIVNELREVKLRRMQTINIFEVLAVLLFQLFQETLKILG